jgi:glucosamine kinase
MSDIVASLDGGGTKTAIVWADQAGNCGQARIEAGCNPQDSGDWLTPVGAALAALPRAPIQITFGIPGFGEIPRLDSDVTRALSQICPRSTVLNDVALAYQGAFPDGGGVLILAGTGSMAMAKGAFGLHRTGGWGDAFGDEGSAYAIGRAALGLCSQMIDGRMPDTGFASNLQSRLGCQPQDGTFALMTWSQSRPRAAVAAIAEHVDDMANSGQPTALAILNSAAVDLHLHAVSVARLAGLPAHWPWTTAGSVFKSRALAAALTHLVGTKPQNAAHSALVGGLMLAARDAGWPTTPNWRQTLKDPT